jgi:methionyl-tRNA formyltransferase
MRIVFMGTPDFAAAALEALLASDHEVCLVVTQPDRPQGRSRRPQPPPVKVLAEAAGLPVFQPEKINTREARARVREADPEVVVVVAYGQILRPLFLAIPPLGCLNVHASILPRWRGASPINAQILHGDPEVGVSVMKMDEGLDTGPVGLVRRLPALPEETAGELHDRLAPLGGDAIVEALASLARDELRFEPQAEEGATYAGLMSKDDGRLDFRRPAEELARQVRGLVPWPGAFATLVSAEERTAIQILQVAEVAATEPADRAGQVLRAEAKTLRVACGEGALDLLTLKPSGRKAMEVQAFLNGARLAPDAHFALPTEESRS